MNSIFRFPESGGYPVLNYQDVYTSDDSWYFDEARRLWPKCMLNNITVFSAPMRDPTEGERFFYHKQKAEGNQFVILWEDGKLFEVRKDGNREELIYAHFFRREFTAVNLADSCNLIKVIPGKIIGNSDVATSDFNAAECRFYKVKYCIKKLNKSIRRYGFLKTFYRQKWSKDHDRYMKQLANQLESGR